MNKAFLRVILIVLALAMLSSTIYAADPEPVTVRGSNGESITYFNDGSTLEVSAAVVVDESAVSSVSSVSTASSAKTIKSNKDVTYKDANGNVEWVYTLHGTFSYEPGVSSKCTAASYDQTIYEGDWHFSNGSATKSGNTAYGKGTYVLKFFFITAKTCDIDISISCDKNGNLK